MMAGSSAAGWQARSAGRRGFTLVEVMIVAGLVGLLAVLTVPSALKSRMTASRHTCASNLRQIESAKEQWAVEHKKTPQDVPAETDLFGRDNYLKFKPRCPEHGTYTLKAPGTRAVCSVPGHTAP